MKILISIAVLIVVSIAFVACKKLKKTPKPRLEFTDEEWEKYYEQKVEGMEAVLGKMQYAMDNGGDKLLSLLKKKGYYPYSDLNRESVVS